jgi:hypothetical protein
MKIRPSAEGRYCFRITRFTVENLSKVGTDSVEIIPDNLDRLNRGILKVVSIKRPSFFEKKSGLFIGK